MTRIYLLIICLLGISMTTAQAGGVVFFEGSLMEAMEAAKKQKKLVFVDAYAVWCGPCKAMNRNTFPDAAVGEYMNDHFINLKLDVEKGEGPAFAQKYAITGMPTLLFLDHQGNEVHRALGYRSPDGLVQEAKRANNPSINQNKLELYYKEGTSDPDILFNYALNQAVAEEDYREAAQRYFDTQAEKELLSERNWAAIQALTTQIESREFQYLLKRRKKFVKRYGEEAVAEKIEAVLRTYVVKASLLQNRALYEQAIEVANTLDDDGLLADKLSMEYAETMEDWGDYGLRAVQYVKKHNPNDAIELDHIASNFLAHISDADLLEQATEWARQSTALDNAFYNNYTYAFLLQRIGRTGDARKIAFKAMRLGEIDGKDVSDLRALVEG